MLLNLFTKQWFEPCSGDWTEKVKENLDEFGMEWDFKMIKAKFKDSFNRMVKIKAKEYAIS